MVYVFVVGPVAITVRYWEERGREVEGGVRVEVRRVHPVIGPQHRPGAEGWHIDAVGDGGLWRSDMLTVVSQPGNKPRHHHHPEFRDGDVGPRVFDPEMADDPPGWTLRQLADLSRLVADAGGADIAAQIHQHDVDRVLPAVRAAIASCMEQMPRIPSDA